MPIKDQDCIIILIGVVLLPDILIGDKAMKQEVKCRFRACDKILHSKPHTQHWCLSREADYLDAEYKISFRVYEFFGNSRMGLV